MEYQKALAYWNASLALYKRSHTKRNLSRDRTYFFFPMESYSNCSKCIADEYVANLRLGISASIMPSPEIVLSQCLAMGGENNKHKRSVK